MNTKEQNIEIIKHVLEHEIVDLSMKVTNAIDNHFGVQLPELTGKVCNLFDQAHDQLEERLGDMVDLAIDRSPRGELIATETYRSKMNPD